MVALRLPGNPDSVDTSNRAGAGRKHRPPGTSKDGIVQVKRINIK